MTEFKVYPFMELWNLLPHPTSSSVIRWMAKDGTGRVWGDFASSSDELIWAAKAHRNKNFYVCPNPTDRREGIRHSSKDVTHWSWLLVDIDPVLRVFNPYTALSFVLKEFYKLYLPGLNLEPLIIDSARGCQAWFYLGNVELDDKIPVGLYTAHNKLSTSRLTATRAMRFTLSNLNKLDVVFGCIVDTTTSDLPRPMRCPGTINLKTGSMTKLVSHGVDFSNYGLAQKLIESTPKEVFEMPVPMTGGCVGLPWQYALPHLTIKARTLLESGWQEPGRHNAMWHTAKKLQELGISKEEAYKALEHGNSMCRNGLGEFAKISQKDVLHALDMAYGV